MLPENKNFEEFMDFRDMIQGDSLDDRMEMVQLLQDQEPVLHMAKPVMNRALSGQVTSEEALKDIEKSMKDKKIASPGDSLAEVFYESYITETAGLGKKTAEKIKKDVENKLSGGLVSLPVVEAGIGGWLGDLAVDFGKSFSVLISTHISRVEKLNLIPLRGGKYPSITKLDGGTANLLG